MNSVILSTATRLILGLMVLFSIYLLFRGHNQPGGGFVGGLVASAAFGLMAISDGTASVRRALRIDPLMIAIIGLAVATLAGVAAAFADAPFFTGLWTFPAGLPLGTPLVFDVGVYLIVLGGVLSMILVLEEDTLVGIREAEIVEADMDGRIANVTVKFVSEQVNVTRDENGDVVDGNPNLVIDVTDYWTFARDTQSSDPNWTLVATSSLD